MFPLGSVLLPGAPLPLHIFEPRYQQLLNETLEDDRTFGVVLITRGWEVGGGDTRATVGTRAVIDEHNRFDDGRAAVVSHGRDRIEIVEWLPDDPYPQALVIDRPTAAPEVGDGARRIDALEALDELLRVAREVGRLQNDPDVEWSDDPELVAWQLATVAPLAVHDRQRILEADRIGERLEIVREALIGVTTDLRLLAELDGD